MKHIEHMSSLMTKLKSARSRGRGVILLNVTQLQFFSGSCHTYSSIFCWLSPPPRTRWLRDREWTSIWRNVRIFFLQDNLRISNQVPVCSYIIEGRICDRLVSTCRWRTVTFKLRERSRTTDKKRLARSIALVFGGRDPRVRCPKSLVFVQTRSANIGHFKR